MKFCEKKTYFSYFEAERVLRRLQSKYRVKRNNRKTRRKEKRVYKCNLCGQYHLTKQREK